MKRETQKQLCFLLSLLMLITLSISNVTVLAAYAQQDTLVDQSNKSSTPKDIAGHWAQTEITDWTAKGFIKGYDDNTFKPDRTMTRAEFITLVNNIFGHKEISSITFKDVKKSD